MCGRSDMPRYLLHCTSGAQRTLGSAMPLRQCLHLAYTSLFDNQDVNCQMCSTGKHFKGALHLWTETKAPAL
jgi:hypothetical protein